MWVRFTQPHLNTVYSGPWSSSQYHEEYSYPTVSVGVYIMLSVVWVYPSQAPKRKFAVHTKFQQKCARVLANAINGRLQLVACEFYRYHKG